MVERLDNSEIDFVKTTEILKLMGVSTDIDGVEVASALLSIKELNRLSGFAKKNPKTIDDVKYYGIMIEWLDEDPDIDDPLVAATSIWNSKYVMETAGRVQGYAAVLKFLERRDIVPYRITSRPGFTRQWTKNWFRRQYGEGFDMNLIRIQGEGADEIDPRFKADEIKRLGIGFHFEDSYENAEEIIINTDATVVLVPQRWNQDYKPTDPKRIIKPEKYKNRTPMVQAFLALAESITNQHNVAQY
jgi:uncharacterized HAD superfamily protein